MWSFNPSPQWRLYEVSDLWRYNRLQLTFASTLCRTKKAPLGLFLTLGLVFKEALGQEWYRVLREVRLWSP